MIGPHVFGDNRLGIWNVSPAMLSGRFAAFRRLGWTDVFLPRTASSVDADRVRQADLFANVYETNASARTAVQYADETMNDLQRLRVGAADLNIELGSDAALEPYIRAVVGRIRATMPSRRLRLNVAWRKGGFLPIDLLRDDPNLFACEQNYTDPPGSTMVPCSAADALENLLDAGVPLEKASVCYGAGGPALTSSSPRVCTYPYGWTPSRGVVFQDDLAAEVGLL